MRHTSYWILDSRGSGPRLGGISRSFLPPPSAHFVLPSALLFSDTVLFALLHKRGACKLWDRTMDILAFTQARVAHRCLCLSPDSVLSYWSSCTSPYIPAHLPFISVYAPVSMHVLHSFTDFVCSLLSGFPALNHSLLSPISTCVLMSSIVRLALSHHPYPLYI